MLTPYEPVSPDCSVLSEYHALVQPRPTRPGLIQGERKTENILRCMSPKPKPTQRLLFLVRFPALSI